MTQKERILNQQKNHKFAPKLTPEDKQKIVELYGTEFADNKTHSYATLAKLFGCHRSAIYKVINKSREGGE